jgi:4,5:9,10-diseco-3-hydroxy-5,9,17-trioxoandrosta-1(10),2-diene-4-oate hydrolase
MSAVPEGKFVEVDSLRIHYQEAGLPKAPVVVFLHGSGPGASGFSNFCRNYPHFAGCGFRVIVPDTVGYGYSSKPTDVDYTLDFLTRCTSRCLDVLGVSRCALVGNSHGGALALNLALLEPKRVSHLLLMAPGGLEDREAYMKMEGISAMMQAFFQPGGIDREGMRRVLRLQVQDISHITEDVVEERLHIAKLQPKRAIATLAVPNLAEKLPELQARVLGFWGVQDKFCPVSGAMTLARGARRARVMLLADCGHWVMVERSELFNRMGVEFLREEEGAA